MKALVERLSRRRDGVREYALVTLAYWGDTIADGAIRMLVLFQFYLMGYSAFQIASLFLFYEIFGVVTNLFGGWIGANMGLRVTLFGGIAIQIVALLMLALLNPAWSAGFVVSFVMFSQALSGIAKDLTKMSSKSAIKAVIPKDADAMMYRWVSLLTGSKNALKGVGFFVGALLLTLTGFKLSLLILAAGLFLLLAALWRHLPRELGRTKEKAKFKSMFSMDRRVNILSAARFFLVGARDV
ncbi:MAG: MFS transporter, partial [Gammaproteobacteria bacterium]